MSFDFEQGAVHVLRTQQGGGGSTKSRGLQYGHPYWQDINQYGCPSRL